MTKITPTLLCAAAALAGALQATPAFAQASFADPINITAWTNRHGSTLGSSDVAVGDLDGDGIQDIVTVSPGVAAVAIVHGAPGGTFSAPTLVTLSTPGRSIALGDVDRNGTLDIVVSDVSGSGIEIFYNEGGDIYQRARFNAGAGITRLALADVDSDHRLDVIGLSASDSTLVFLTQIPDGNDFTRQGFTVPSASSMTVADMNGDGTADVVVATGAGFTVFYLGASAVQDVADIPVSGGLIAVAAADFDGDGVMDVVGTQLPAANAAKAILVPGMSARPFFAAPPSGGYSSWAIGSAPWDVAAADLDGDGIPDLAVTDAAGSFSGLPNGAVRILSGGFVLNHGQKKFQFATPGTVVTLFPDTERVVLADVNGDSLLDIVTANEGAVPPGDTAVDVSVLIRAVTAADLQQLLDKITSLQQQTVNLAGQIATQQSQLADALDQVSGLQLQNGSLQNQLSTANATIQGLNGQIDTLTTQKNALAADNQTLTAQNSTLTAANQSLTTQAASLQTQVTNLTAQNQQLTDQNAGLTQSNQTLTAENGSLIAANRSLTAQVAGLQTQVTSLTSQNQQLTAQNAALAQANQTLQSQLAEANAKLTSENAAIDTAILATQQDLRIIFGDPHFVVPGATRAARWLAIIRAIEGLNRGRKQGVYEGLGGRPQSRTGFGVRDSEAGRTPNPKSRSTHAA